MVFSTMTPSFSRKGVHLNNKYSQAIMYGQKLAYKTLYEYLISMDKKYLNKSLLEKEYKYDIFFYKV